MSADYAAIDALVAAAQAGCRQAREALLCQYEPLLRSLSWGWHDAEDCYQDAACGLLDLVRSYRPERGVWFGQYLRTMLRWRLHNRRRFERRRTDRDEPLVELPIETPDPAELLDVRAALALLPARQREVLARRYWLGQSDEEIARDWRISRRAVTGLRLRAQRAIHDRLQQLD